jgi:hypothetical protein
VGLSRFEGGRSLALAPVAGNLANKAIGPHILDLGAGPRPVALDVTGRVTRVDRVMHGRHTVYAFDARKVHAYPQGLHEGSFDIIFLNNPYGMRTGEAVYRKWCRLLGPRGMVVIQGHISNREFAAMWTRDDEWIRKLGFRQVLRRVGGKPIGGSFSSTDPAGTPPRPDKIMVWAK